MMNRSWIWFAVFTTLSLIFLLTGNESNKPGFQLIMAAGSALFALYFLYEWLRE